MKINLDEIRQRLTGMLEAAMESDSGGVWTIQIDSDGNVAAPEPGRKRWLHKLLNCAATTRNFTFW